MQDPIVLNNNSEPEPDIAICVPEPDKYKQAHPTADQVIIVIEVAETSLTFDRTGKPVHTRALAFLNMDRQSG